MAERSAIAWTDHSFAPWHGCTKVSTGPLGACVGCYAENIDVTRFKKVEGFGNFPRVRAPDSTWKQPRAWDRKAAAAGEQRFVFCSHLSDVFDNQVDPTWRADLFLLMHETPHLIWLLLTKRPQNILKLGWPAHIWPKNAAIGCTVVTQEEANRDVPVLLYAKQQLNPAFAFLSCEPLMGPINLREAHQAPIRLPRVDQVIAGGETNQGKHRARDSDEAWFRDLRDQCAAAGVPFFMKQMPRKAPIPADLMIQQRPSLDHLARAA